MTELETDLRQGVTPAVHRVLDVLDRCRPGWAQLSDDGLRAEMAIESAAQTGSSATRAAALVLFAIERSDAAAEALANINKDFAA